MNTARQVFRVLVDLCFQVKQSDYIGKKYVILFFYPLDSLDFTIVYHFFNSVEITAFSDRHPEFDKINTEILGVSIDSVVCFPYPFFPFVFLELLSDCHLT